MVTVFDEKAIMFIRENADKMTLDEMAKAVKIKRQTVYDYCKRNKITLKPRQNVRKALTTDEIEYIKNHAMTLKTADIAKGINRNTSTVYTYIQKHNIPHKKYNNARLTPREIKYIRENANIRSIAEIARSLGRSVHCVTDNMQRLGLYKARRYAKNKICPWRRTRNNGYNQNPITDTTKMLTLHYYVENSENGLSETDNIANICNCLNRTKSDILAILADFDGLFKER